MKTPTAAIALIMMFTAGQIHADAKKTETADKAVKTATSATVTVPAKKVQTLCPIMSEEINKTLYVDFGGKRIYVCCRGCIGTVQKDPLKYIKMLEAQCIELEKVPVKK